MKPFNPRKLFLFLMTMFLIVSCTTPAATPSAAPTQEVVLTPATSTPTATPTLPLPPTKIVKVWEDPVQYYGTNIGVMAGELGSVVFFTTDGGVYGMPKGELAGEHLISELTGGKTLWKIAWYDTANGKYLISDPPTKDSVWFKDNRLMTCDNPCKGQFEYVEGELFNDVVDSLGIGTAEDIYNSSFLAYWRVAFDNSGACYARGARSGVIFPCTRRKSATETPVPLSTPTTVPTTAPTTSG